VKQELKKWMVRVEIALQALSRQHVHLPARFVLQALNLPQRHQVVLIVQQGNHRPKVRQHVQNNQRAQQGDILQQLVVNFVPKVNNQLVE